MPNINADEFKAIANLIEPYCKTEQERRDLLTLLEQEAVRIGAKLPISYGGTAIDFTNRLIVALLTFGEIRQGEQALAMLLAEIQRRVGLGQQAEIARLLPFVNAAAPPHVSQVRRRIVPFLLAVGAGLIFLVVILNRPTGNGQGLQASITPGESPSQPATPATPATFATEPSPVPATPVPPTASNTAVLQVATAAPTPTLILAGAAINWTPVEHSFDGVLMVLVPAGCFAMGSSDGDSDELPIREVCITQPFWLDKFEVYQSQFRAKNGVAQKNPAFSGDRHPIENINWFEADAFCKLRGAQLPTEAQWEYAARGPEGRIWPWGNRFVGANARWGLLRGPTAEVGMHPNGRSWVGAMDLAGNVWEWVADWYADYPGGAAQPDPTGPTSGSARATRGGAFLNVDNLMRGANRGEQEPTTTTWYLGFRCALSAIP